MKIKWGPSIALRGRPAWLDSKTPCQCFWPDGGWSSRACRPAEFDQLWERLLAIRVPADHFAYKAIAAGFEPWAGGDLPPIDWDQDKCVLVEDGSARPGFAWNWSAEPVNGLGMKLARIIGYHKKEKTMTEPAPEAPNTDAMPTPDAIARELATTQAQRNALGQIAAHWIGRFFALKAAGGDIPPANIVPSTEAALREVDAMMQQLAASGE